jgi:hypothetical protein
MLLIAPGRERLGNRRGGSIPGPENRPSKTSRSRLKKPDFYGIVDIHAARFYLIFMLGGAIRIVAKLLVPAVSCVGRGCPHPVAGRSLRLSWPSLTRC